VLPRTKFVQREPLVQLVQLVPEQEGNAKRAAPAPCCSLRGARQPDALSFQPRQRAWHASRATPSASLHRLVFSARQFRARKDLCRPASEFPPRRQARSMCGALCKT